MFKFFLALIIILGTSFALVLNAQTIPSNVPIQHLWSVDLGNVSDVVYSEDGQTAYLGGTFQNLVSPSGSGFILPSVDSDELPISASVSGGNVNVSISDGQGGWYIGGNFTSVAGVNQGKIAHILENGLLDPNFNVFLNNQVYSLFLDGENDILYVGGAFTQVNGQNKSYLAVINTNTSLATGFNVTPNAEVQEIVLSPDGNTMFIGGFFTMVAGQPRKSFAQIDIVNNQLSSLNLNLGSGATIITSMYLDASNNVIYLGGSFSTILGQPRTDLAAVDLDDGTLTSFAPQITGYVQKILLNQSTNTLYIAGNFSAVNGLTRYDVAALNFSTGSLLPWNPFVGILTDNTQLIYDIALDSANNTIYLAGTFNRTGNGIGGFTSNSGFVALDTVSTSTIAWNSGLRFADFSNPNVGIRSVEFDPVNSRIFIGSKGQIPQFEAFVPRNGLGAIDMQTGAPTAWDPNPSDRNISALEIDHESDTLYVGGSFTSIGGQSRNSLASFNTNTGTLRPWNPSVTLTNSYSHVKDLILNKLTNTLYIGGKFSHVGTQARSHLAAVNTSTGEPVSWNPGVIGFGPEHILGSQPPVNALEIDRLNDRIYVGGYITQAGGQIRNRFASISLSTGQVLPWAPNFETCDEFGNCGGSVGVIELDSENDKLYVGGGFSNVNNQSRMGLVSFNTETEQMDAWDPNLDSSVGALLLDSSNHLLYVGGGFRTVMGQNRGALASFNTQNGTLTSWTPDLPVFTNLSHPGISNFAYDGEHGVLHVAGAFYDECTIFNSTECREGYEAYLVEPTGDSGSCPADFDNNGTADVTDIFAFLSAWFAQDISADFDGDGNVVNDVQDIFSFLSAWFAGC